MSFVCEGKQGTKYVLEEPCIGKGGEGSVYNIVGMSKYVAKIYNDKHGRGDATKRYKIETMLNIKLPQAVKSQIAWPQDILTQKGVFVGYVMQKISNTEKINGIYSNSIDTISLDNKIVIAKNLCAAIDAVHGVGQVCGDLNPNNIAVDAQNAQITLLDTDSFHITDKRANVVYRCEVGLPEYIAPEIQNKLKHTGEDLRHASLPTFTKESDLFALAVHIFALLMNGCHPFACAPDTNFSKVNIPQLSYSATSVVAPQPAENICNGISVFLKPVQGLIIPIYAPDFSALPNEIQILFKRAFESGFNNPQDRPTAAEWYNALENMKNNLAVCKVNRTHMYYSSLAKCPWCEVKNNLARMMGQQPTPIITTVLPQQTTTLNINPSKGSGGTNIVSPNYPPQSPPIRTGGIINTTAMFWIITLAISIGVMVLLELVVYPWALYEGVVSDFFELGILGSPVTALIGLLLSNLRWFKADDGYYTAGKYVQSTLTTIAFMIGGFFLSSIGFAVVIIGGCIAIVIGVMSLL